MDKETFSTFCRQNRSGDTHRITETVLPEVSKFLLHAGQHKLPVIWLETDDSGDNNIAFMNSTYPYAGQIFEDMIDLIYSNTFMAAQGDDALRILFSAAEQYKGVFTLVVEGAIPTKDNGLYCVIAQTQLHRITALEAVQWLGSLAKYVVAVGTCACFGGPTSAEPNITSSVGVSAVLARDVIHVSGCPINPDWFVGTLAHLLMYGIPELDKLGRPTLFYENTVHRHCQRRSYFDRQDYAKHLGDKECMFSLGCMGPRTHADCPYRQWINYVNWPVRANTPCIGCTTPNFPDGSSPFFTPIPQKGHSRDPQASPGGKEHPS